MHASSDFNSMRGRSTGTLVMTGFGALWLLLALCLFQSLTAANLCLLSAGVLALAAGALRLRRAAACWPRVPSAPGMGRTFGWINFLQWAAIAVVLNILQHLHLIAYEVSAVALIVGLHFFPLARLFRNGLHLATGAALTLWAIGTMLLSPLGSMQALAALGAGLILWASAAATVALSLRTVRRRALSPGAA